MKKIAVLLVCVLLAIGIMTKSVSADVDSDMVLLSETITYIDESTYYIERIYVPEVCPYSNTRMGTKTIQCVYGGNVIFTLSVTGQFTYDGRTARATCFIEQQKCLYVGSLCNWQLFRLLCRCDTE